MRRPPFCLRECGLAEQVAGPAYRPSRDMIYGWSIGFEDPSVVSKSRGGQTWIDVQKRFRVLRFTLANLSETEAFGNIFDYLFRRKGIAGVQFTEDNFAGTAYANEQTGFPKALEKIVEHVATTAVQARANLGLTNGPTKPRYNRLTVGNPNGTYSNLIPLTSGAGYLNGINIYFIATDASSYAYSCNIEVSIDGGTPQVVAIQVDDYSTDFYSAPGINTGYIPFNLRFNSSIQVRGARTSGNNSVIFTAAWALD